MRMGEGDTRSGRLNHASLQPSSAQAPKGVNGLPLELLDAVLACIDEPSDLLHLALTCKSLCSFIIPEHLYFRVIRCRVQDTRELWILLSQNVRLASRVRSLTVFGDYINLNERIPPAYYLIVASASLTVTGDVDSKGVEIKLSNADLMRKALRQMKGLARFEFETVTLGWLPASAGDRAHERNGGQLDPFWEILGRAKNLVHLSVGTWVHLIELERKGPSSCQVSCHYASPLHGRLSSRQLYPSYGIYAVSKASN